MLSTLVLATLLLAPPHAAPEQLTSTLHIKAVLADADGKPVPVPRHALLVSDTPASAPPRLIVTGPDGTADVKLRPGNYTVESDRAVAFGGRTWQWTALVDVAGPDTTLELTAANAEVVTDTSASSSSSPAGDPIEADPEFLLPRWQQSVVGLWTPDTHASAFVIDARGLLATNQRVVGDAQAVEVQLTPDLKVAGRILAADPDKDVAVLWVDPQAIASVRPVPLGCGEPAASVVYGQELYTIAVPFRQHEGMWSGTASRVDAHVISADFLLARGSDGGPVFAAGGDLIGITSSLEDRDGRPTGDARVVRVADVCDVVDAAERKMTGASAPAGTRLPLDPATTFPRDALEAAVKGSAGKVSPYRMTSSSFDVAFITPVLTYSAAAQAERMRTGRTDSNHMPDMDQSAVRPLMDFGVWSDYVRDYPPVLLVRVTPKLVEGFWTTVGRFAARTQGVSLPPIRHFSSGFARLRAFCGDAEVTPIHPFRLAQRISDTDAVHEGLYAFDPGALGPHCGTVRLELFSEKEPDKADSRTVPPDIVEQFWRDFAAHRDAAR
jgi:S1-C subfamily serine protease